MRPDLTICFTFLLVWSTPSWAQQTTIINHFQGDTAGRGLDSFRLTHTAEHRVVINYYEPAPLDQTQRLNELIAASLNFYIDQSVQVSGGKVSLRKPARQIMRDMEEIVRNAVRYYDLQEKEPFRGFSGEVARRLEELPELDFSRSDLAAQVTDAASRRRLEFYFVQRHLNDLKLVASLEVGHFSNANLLQLAASEATLVDEATRDSLLRSLEFSEGQPLRPVFTDDGKELMALLTVEDESSLPGAEAATPPEEWTGQIVSMLEANNRKLDAMQEEINALRAEQVRQWQQQQEARNDQMQAQIDDLRSMLTDLVRMSAGLASESAGEVLVGPAVASGSGVFNIPSSVEIYFAKGAVKPDAEGVFTLNEVVDILARNPEMRLLITGHADRSGDAVGNLLISQQRASSVRDFLLRSGLPKERFVTRYVGDSRSEQESESDRKVVLEFIR